MFINVDGFQAQVLKFFKNIGLILKLVASFEGFLEQGLRYTLYNLYHFIVFETRKQLAYA